MGLFDRKYCSVCGDKIALLGNRKLEDGNLCKNCAGKLSPWFSERRHSTLEEIRRQLDYREANKAAVAAFHASRTLGRNTKVYIDEDARTFMVTSAKNLAEANPDVIHCSAVTDCYVDSHEFRRELKHADKDGKQVSYVPPKYEYTYDLYAVIRVNHPYFDEIRFKLNPSSIQAGGRSVNYAPVSAAHRNRPISAVAVGALLDSLAGAQGSSQRKGPTWNTEYNDYLALGEAICDMLMALRQEHREETAAQNEPKAAVTCPHCGAPTIPDANGCCEYCGGALDV